MNELLLIDGNSLAIRLFLSPAVQTASGAIVGNYNLWRYLMFANIIGHSTVDTKRIVFAVDGKNGSWRKKAFKPYKANRKAKRDAEEFDWNEFFEVYRAFTETVSAYLPIKVINIDHVEGDDVVGTISLNEDGYDNIKVVTSDSDYKQLIRPNVHVYDPMKNEYMVCENVKEWLLEQILTGQAKDNIYNILTPDDWGETPETAGKRKPGFGPVAAKKAMSGNVKDWLIQNKLMGNYARNALLVDLSLIPEEIVSYILTSYAVPEEKYDPVKVNKFFELYDWPSLKYDSEDSRKAHEVLMRLS